MQGSLAWRVADPLRRAERVDFSVALTSGCHEGEPIEHLDISPDLLATVLGEFRKGSPPVDAG